MPDVTTGFMPRPRKRHCANHQMAENGTSLRELRSNGFFRLVNCRVNINSQRVWASVSVSGPLHDIQRMRAFIERVQTHPGSTGRHYRNRTDRSLVYSFIIVVLSYLFAMEIEGQYNFFSQPLLIKYIYSFQRHRSVH